jgi:hypothetical protein
MDGPGASRSLAAPEPFHGAVGLPARRRRPYARMAASSRQMTSNPLRILQVLDRHLTTPCELTIYGRSALVLGFSDASAEMAATLDVDAILPARDIALIEANDDFWRAQDLTNQELDETGLYFTHLFEDRQVILRPDWLEHRVPITNPALNRLRLYRPATADLILTKMMRNDPQDRDDIVFLLRQPDFHLKTMREALAQAVVPDIPEIREAFETNCKWLKPRLFLGR